MARKIWLIAFTIVGSAAIAGAVDFGGHVGYFGNDVQKADVGVNMMVPLGVIAVMPNIDYTKQANAGLWFGNADVAFRFSPNSKNGPSYWVGAGPTYGYISNYGSGTSGYAVRNHPVRAQQYTPPGGGGGSGGGSGSGGSSGSSGSNNHSAFDQFGGNTNAWGWDVNAGASWGGSNWRPYVIGRYNQVHDLKTAGVALGLRFGH